MSQNGLFGEFSRAYKEWLNHTDALSLRHSPRLQDNGFELDLDHFIGYVRHILSRAHEHSTQLDYPKLAAEYLQDLDRLQKELDNTMLPKGEHEVYSNYILECRQMLKYLAQFPVSPEGHLQFRRHAIEAFQFLIDDYGYELIQTSPTDVCFRSGKMSVEISYWPQTPQGSINVQVNEDGAMTGQFFLDDFAFVDGLGPLFDYQSFDLHSPQGVGEFLRAAADLIHRCGEGLLKGERNAIQEFQKKAAERERLYVEMMEGRQSDAH